MGTETLEVLFSPVKSESYAHSFLLYTNSTGQKFIARGGPSSETPLDLATGNSQLNTVADEASNTKDKDNINVPSAFRTTVSTGSEAAADWKQIQTFAKEVNGQYGYHASQNSNSFTHAALTSIGKGNLAFPSGIQPADVIGWTNSLTQPLGMPLVNDVVSGLGYLTRPGPWSLSRQALETGTFLGQGGSVTTLRDHTGYAAYSGPPAGLSDLLLALGSDALNLAERGWSAVLDGLNTVTDPTQSYGIWENTFGIKPAYGAEGDGVAPTGGFSSLSGWTLSSSADTNASASRNAVEFVDGPGIPTPGDNQIWFSTMRRRSRRWQHGATPMAILLIPLIS